jgi:two-component SAPR family response regulator
LSLTLFGRFACALSGRPIVFPRRREQNVLAYIALSTDAAVSRNELMQTFWPNVPPAVASQGLRTTLSRLRKTIADASGEDARRYIRIDPAMISLDLDHVTIDARRFTDHVEQGKLADGRGDVAGCREHYRMAERLYANALLAAEAVEPALTTRVADYASTFEAILRRLVELHLSAADVASADSYARRLAAQSAHHTPRRSSFGLALASQTL